MEKSEDDYAIVIGIDTYPELFRLRSAHEDASEFVDWLIKKDGGGLGLRRDHVSLVLGPPKVRESRNPKPVQRHIDEQLEKWGIVLDMEKRIARRIGRRLYFYFAGHGIGPTYDNVGMLMIDCSNTNFNSNIGLREYRQLFREHHIFDEIVYIIDCCRDPAPPVSGLQWQAPKINLTPQKRRGEVREFGVMAAAYGKEAYAVPTDNGRRQGLLTRALLEGFTSPKAADELYRVTSSTLWEYVLSRVPQLVEDLKNDEKQKADLMLIGQMPEIMAIPYPPFYFTTIPTGQPLRVHIIAGPGRKGSLILYDGEGNQLATHATKDATATRPWEVQLDRNRFAYMVEHSAGGKPPILIQPKSVTQEPHIVKIST